MGAAGALLGLEEEEERREEDTTHALASMPA